MEAGFAFHLERLWRDSDLFENPDDHSMLFTTSDVQILPYHPHIVESNHPWDALKELQPLQNSDSFNVSSQIGERDVVQKIHKSNHSGIVKSAEALSISPWPLEDLSELKTDIPDRSWEGFTARHGTYKRANRTTMLSEAGITAFDAVVRLNNTLKRPNRPANSILDHDIVYRTCCNLILGRSSVLFQWSDSDQAFTPTMPELQISGLSEICAHDVVNELCNFGSHIRRVKSNSGVNSTMNVTSNQMGIALKCCTTEILDALELILCKALPMARSLLQIQFLIQQPLSLLEELAYWLDTAQNANTDEDLISNCADRLQTMASRGSMYTKIFDTLLRRIVAPWVKSILQDLGIQADKSSSLLQSDHDVDIMRERSKNSERAIETRISALPPHLMSADDKELIADIRSYIRLLEYRSTTEYLESVTLLPSIEVAQQMCPIVESELANVDSSVTVEQLDMRVADLPSSYGQGSTAELWTSLLESSLSYDGKSIEQETQLCCDNDVDPLKYVRSLLSTHRVRLSFEALHFVFVEHNLLEHLELQFQYHLFGSDDFVSRMSTALFSMSAQSSERRCGNIPTSAVIGLRLDSKHNRSWPPASSEVRLTLANVLKETSNTAFANPKIPAATRLEILNALSFSIRELSEVEIEQVLDAKSIHALDFLRLQYSMPDALSQIFTPEAMNWYDNIFRFLLQTLRMKHVVATVHLHVLKNRQRQSHSSLFSFVREAGHFVTVLLSHFIDVGIRTPWQKFIKTFERTEKFIREATGPPNVPNPELDMTSLRTSHNQCLDEIRARLFLHKRQNSIHEAIEKGFTCILDFSANVDDNMVSYFAADLSVATQILVEELRKVSSVEASSRRTRSTYSVSVQESFSLLLARLQADIIT